MTYYDVFCCLWLLSSIILTIWICVWDPGDNLLGK
jgi:hypothetical protein